MRVGNRLEHWTVLACLIGLIAGCETAPISQKRISLASPISKKYPLIPPGTSRGDVISVYGPPVLIHRDADPNTEYLHYHVIKTGSSKGEDTVYQYYVAVADGVVTASGTLDDFNFSYRPAH